ncbi:spore coat protein [Paenibacillus nanensis]|nr:spore coat protein [Paenibacillus nanensis]
MLHFAKTAVRNIAIAITEAATTQLRKALQKHLIHALKPSGNIL